MAARSYYMAIGIQRGRGGSSAPNAEQQGWKVGLSSVALLVAAVIGLDAVYYSRVGDSIIVGGFKRMTYERESSMSRPAEDTSQARAQTTTRSRPSGGAS